VHAPPHPPAGQSAVPSPQSAVYWGRADRIEKRHEGLANFQPKVLLCHRASVSVSVSVYPYLYLWLRVCPRERERAELREKRFYIAHSHKQVKSSARPISRSEGKPKKIQPSMALYALNRGAITRGRGLRKSLELSVISRVLKKLVNHILERLT